MTNFEHNGTYFRFEVLNKGDDVYKDNTLLLIANDTTNIVSKSFATCLTNEFDLRTWNNDLFKQFINNILDGKDNIFNCAVKDDRDIIVPIEISFKNNILKIPLHEGKYHIDDLNLKVDELLCNELLFMCSKINT